MADEATPPHNAEIERAVLQTVLSTAGTLGGRSRTVTSAGGMDLFFHRRID